MNIRVISAHVEGTDVVATVHATNHPHAKIVLALRVPISGPVDIWSLAKDEALRYLDVA